LVFFAKKTRVQSADTPPPLNSVHTPVEDCKSPGTDCTRVTIPVDLCGDYSRIVHIFTSLSTLQHTRIAHHTRVHFCPKHWLLATVSFGFCISSIRAEFASIPAFNQQSNYYQDKTTTTMTLSPHHIELRRTALRKSQKALSAITCSEKISSR